MITKKYLIVGALAALGVLFVVRRANAARALQCGAGKTFLPMTVAEAREKWGSFASWPQIEEQVRKYGATCVSYPTVIDAGTRPMPQNATTDGIDDQGQDPVLITHPWQLL